MKIWMVILCVLLLNISQSVTAAIGTITEQVKNPAQIQRSAKTLSGAKGAGVEMMDTIKTNEGKIGIVFQDDTKVQVSENSKLVIDEFVYDPKSKDKGRLALNMASGTVRYASGAIARNNPNNVNINTPTATVAVRGTDFTATIDELGESTFILLPSCPRTNMLPDEIDRECKVGVIDVFTDAGGVTLDQAFQATKVTARGQPPTKPTILKINENAISNLLILAPPQELMQARKDQQNQKNTFQGTALTQNFLAAADLGNVLAEQNAVIFSSTTLDKNFLSQDFLADILTLLNEELSKEFGNLLAKSKSNSVLPDYTASMQITATVTPISVTLYRSDSSGNQVSVTVPRDQNSQITQTQNENVGFKNRVNQGGNTYISTKQN